ncbi:MAG: hydroxymethylbilane synthase [Gammaproteobacteria bacterium]|nr:MAG: hydroxymethylbilane synthase [Gammaproteobacteria bacterium]
MLKKLTIATRVSPLALWQAEYIKQRLLKIQPNLTIDLLKMKTQGDKILDTPLAKIGGKGLFVKELEQGLLDKKADIAVHSIKDVPMDFPTGLKLGAICNRESPFDAFVSNKYQKLEQIPVDAVIGTSSLRRGAQLKFLYPNLKIMDLRGNVNTRLKKLDDGQYDAIILAEAGLIRLGFNDRIKHSISEQIILPAVGQGALGIEIRDNDKVVEGLIQQLSDKKTYYCVSAERALNKKLNGGCQVPIAGYATIDDNNKITLNARVISIDGTALLKACGSGDMTDAVNIGNKVADDLLKQGAGEILSSIGL